MPVSVFSASISLLLFGFAAGVLASTDLRSLAELRLRKLPPLFSMLVVELLLESQIQLFKRMFKKGFRRRFTSINYDLERQSWVDFRHFRYAGFGFRRLLVGGKSVEQILLFPLCFLIPV